MVKTDTQVGGKSTLKQHIHFVLSRLGLIWIHDLALEHIYTVEEWP